MHASEEDNFDSEVDHIVEWAKDAPALEPQQEIEEEPICTNTLSTMLGKVDSKRTCYCNLHVRETTNCYL